MYIDEKHITEIWEYIIVFLNHLKKKVHEFAPFYHIINEAQ